MKLYNYYFAALALLITFGCTKGDRNAGTADKDWLRAGEMVKQMTFDEKIGQMNQISPYGDINEIAGMIRTGAVGSVLNVADVETANFLQKVAMEESRMKIPLIIGRDVIHGFKTIFPIPLGQAASFNPEMVQQGARIAAVEASSQGVNWTFAPMIDIARDPRWGRIAESLGEDTYLASVLGVAMINGFQGDDMTDGTSIAACPKHFVGYGAAEAGKDYNSTSIPERLLRNVYLPPFKAAADAGAATFMTSFNDNDGVPSTGNKFILDQVLRKEWGFKGFVVSDWASISEMIAHGFAADAKEAAQKAVNAGVDMDMVSFSYLTNAKELVDEKKVSIETINESVQRILYIKIKLGLFDNYLVDTSESSPIYADSHLKAAKQAAIQSAVLLKNDKGTLPLNSSVKTVAVVGPMADAPHDQLGTWVFDGEKSHTQTPLAYLREKYADKLNIVYVPALSYSRDNDKSQFTKALDAARKADAVIAFVGEEAILSGEAHSLANLNLQGAQSELVEQLAKAGKPLVTVFMAGRPLTIAREVQLSDAVLYNFHPGTMGGPAIIDLLFGKAIPSGKLPVTFPKSVGQIPIYYAHNNTGRPFQGSETLINDIPLEAGQTSLGNTSFHLDQGFAPLFPFGYGLSYTTFEYSNLRLSADKVTDNDVITVTADVKNTGLYDAVEIVQLYVQDCVGSVTRPVKELKDFARVNIKAGETAKVSFELPISKLAFNNIDMKYMVEPGIFNLWVGTNSAEGLSTSFEVK